MGDIAVLVRYIAIFTSTIFGVVGVIGPTRKNDRLTAYSYIAIVGILASAAIAGITQYLSDQSKIAADRAREAQLAADIAWQKHTLANIQRELFAIDTWKLIVTTRYKADDVPLLKALAGTWDRYAARHPTPDPARTNIRFVPGDNVFIQYAPVGKGAWRPWRITLKSDSVLYPKAAKTGMPSEAVMATSAFMLLMGQPSSLAHAAGCGEGASVVLNRLRDRADLAIVTGIFKPGDGNAVFTYDAIARQVEILSYIDRTTILKARRLYSMADISGKMLLVALTPWRGRIEAVTLELARGSQTDWSRTHAYNDPIPDSVCGNPAALFRVAPRDFQVVNGTP